MVSFVSFRTEKVPPEILSDILELRTLFGPTRASEFTVRFAVVPTRSILSLMQTMAARRSVPERVHPISCSPLLLVQGDDTISLQGVIGRDFIGGGIGALFDSGGGSRTERSQPKYIDKRMEEITRLLDYGCACVT
jgi:hypothetical protein